MIARTAFNQLHHSSLLLLGTLLGLFVTFLLPIMLVCSGHLRYALPGAAGWLLMSAVYAPMVRFYGLPVFWSLTLPFAACFYGGATVLSAVRYWRGSGGLWKGRVQDERPIQPRRSRVDR